MSGLHFEASLAERGVDVTFTLGPGRTLALLGPNGAGKSTVLGLLAGLLSPTTGRATLEERVLFDVTGGRGTVTEARHRGIALLSQEALLFPHLTVLENVAFGPRSQGHGKTRARSTAGTWLERIGATHLARRRPHQLSGGQAQRVAIARALAADPLLLLLDEPLAALDVTAAPVIRALLRDVLADRSVVIVSHDPLDALLLADDVLILDNGGVVESGPTREVLTRPTTEFGARLAGLNLVPGYRTGAGFCGERGLVVPFSEESEGSPLALVVRPSHLTVARTAGHQRDWSWMAAIIDDVEQHGELVRVRLAGLIADVPPADVVEHGLAVGSPAFVGFRHADAHIQRR